jgi:hypothetical protein
VLRLPTLVPLSWGCNTNQGAKAMSDDEIARINSKRWVVISASAFSVVTDPRSGEREVVIHLDIPDNQLGMAPNTGLALRLSPREARQIAEALRKKADEAEVGLPRA